MAFYDPTLGNNILSRLHIYIVGYKVTHYLSGVLIGKAVCLLLDARKVDVLDRAHGLQHRHMVHCNFSAYEGLKMPSL